MDGITGKVESLSDCINPVITAGGNFKADHFFLFVDYRKKAEITAKAFKRNIGSAPSATFLSSLKSCGSRLNAKSGCLTFKGLKQDPVYTRLFFFNCVHSSSPGSHKKILEGGFFALLISNAQKYPAFTKNL